MPSPTDPTPTPNGEQLAALALGLSASWLGPERREEELRAAAPPEIASVARQVLLRMHTCDPVAASRGLRLLERAFPSLDRTLTLPGDEPASGLRSTRAGWASSIRGGAADPQGPTDA